MKFYNDTDTNNIIGMVPFFLAGTAFDTHDDDMKELLTGSTDEADIFCTHIDRFDSIQTFIDTIQLMKDISKNRDVFWIIEAKDEMVVDWKWEQIKEASKYFRKDRLLLFNPDGSQGFNDLATQDMGVNACIIQYYDSLNSSQPAGWVQLNNNSAYVGFDAEL